MLCGVHSPEVNGNKGKPNDTGRVHGESDVLWLVEGGGDFAGEDSVNGAQDDEEYGISEGDHVRNVRVRRADQQVVLPGRIVMDGVGRRKPHPGQTYHA